jgi:heme/copper-type cytochrome/quinol oxidase subunit 3
MVLYVMFGWWSDTMKEAHEGHHTRVVSLHLRYGMIMFIASEVMFFVAWFWAFFDASLFPSEAAQVARVEFLGGHVASGRHRVLDPFHLPLYNTIILLLSGTTVTWAHHALLHNDRKGLINGLALTVVLGVLFSFVQGYEYGRAVQPLRLDLRRDLLHGDRLPWLPRVDRHHLPARVPVARDARGTSPRSSISASRRQPGTGISLTWCGSSSSPASMYGHRPARQSRRTEQPESNGFREAAVATWPPSFFGPFRMR